MLVDGAELVPGDGDGHELQSEHGEDEEPEAAGVVGGERADGVARRGPREPVRRDAG